MSQLLNLGTLKSAMVGVFIIKKSVNTTNHTSILLDSEGIWVEVSSGWKSCLS